MDIQEMKAQRFPKVTEQDWEKAAEASLKGKPLAALHTGTYEEITLKPLYGPADRSPNVEQYPGLSLYTRGFYSGGYMEVPWKNANVIRAENGADLKGKLTAALHAGQDAIAFEAEEAAALSFAEFSSLPLEEHPLYIDAKDHFLAIASFLLKQKPDKLTGAAGTDLISFYAKQGLVLTEQTLALQAETMTELKKAFPELKTIRIDTVPYHEAGANAFQEISLALAEAVFYIEWLKEEGWSPEEIAERMCVHFAMGSQFFMETAKLRAFRQCWATLCEAYGITGSAVKVSIGAETSSFTLSKLDSHVNILRTGSEAFSAVLGGVEYLQVRPFDELSGTPSSLGQRVAKNIPLILKSEAHLGKVADPAGGSYYLESLTAELSRLAWEHFTALEEAGGVMSCLRSGKIQKELAALLEKRSSDLAVRKKSMVGTNIYADLTESKLIEKPAFSLLPAENEADVLQDRISKISETTTIAELHVKKSGDGIIPVKSQRLAEPFEKLREKAERIGATAGIICLGTLKEFKQRADFVTGMLAAGGLAVQWSEGCQTVEEAVEFVKESGLSYYCICGRDESYNQFGSQLASTIKQRHPGVRLDLAGRLPEEDKTQWQQAGLDGWIYSGQNLIEKAIELLDHLEGVSAHE
ncbi:methylmalonyl-CoA mutase [Bacillus badius]|uniref:methylmalonyl-CoA mutase family protein n=1 Tax=Bacillus badius TaxID=1455 RepID=UPI001CBED9D1|nr:methylmalonyl-CoA mutase family protein [Bacillus badius]UAT29337.1 methylmalonyl-CoA mutase [Bacillus badius]